MAATIFYPLPFPDRFYPVFAELQSLENVISSPATGLSSNVHASPDNIPPPLRSWIQRHVGIGLNASERVSRLLILYRKAVEAESEGYFFRADFFWRELYSDLQRMWSDGDLWACAAKTMHHSSDGIALQAEELRTRLIAEVFIETHCAFYNGYVLQVELLKGDSRAFVHSGYIAQLLDLAKISNEAAKTLLIESARARIEALRANAQWDEAIRVCEDLLQHFPVFQQFQDDLVDLHYVAAMQSLHGGESQSDNAADAKRLHAAIHRLESARCRFPRNLNFYRTLGECHRILAIKLANAGELAEGLAAARWAQKYDPYLEEAVHAEEQLIGMMTQLQAEVTQLQAQLAQQPGTQLNAEGQRLLRDAQTGFEPMNKIEDSAFATGLVRDFQLAQARGLWLSVGLPEPMERWDEYSLALLDAIGGIFSDPPACREDIAGAWSRAAAGSTELAGINPNLVETFLRRRLFDTGELAPASPAASSSIQVAAPVTTVVKERPSLEPLDYWLFSRQDLRVKVQGLVVAGVLSAGSFLYLSDAHDREIRDQAYMAMRQSAAEGADEDIMRAAESFLAVQLHGGDGREKEVQRQYDSAFSRWFVAKGYTLDDDARIRIERFRQLGGT